MSRGRPGAPVLAPVELRVLATLRARVPTFQWDAQRVVLCVRDFQAHVDVEEVSAKCADWLMSGQAKRVKDGPGTLRAFLERAKATNPSGGSLEPRLAVYDRSIPPEAFEALRRSA